MNEIPLHRYLTESPEKQYFTLKSKALAFTILEKISWVAIIAIMAVVVAISYSGMILAGPASLLIAGMVLSTPIIAFGGANFAIWARGYAQQAEVEGQVANELREIAHWETPQIEHFMRDQGLDFQRIPIGGKELLPVGGKELLPVIGRFNYLQKEAIRLEEKSEAGFSQALQEAVREIRHQTRVIAYEDHQKAISTALNGAIMLQIIQQPFNLALDIQQPDWSLPGLGICTPKTFVEDLEDSKYAPVDAEYFTFHPDVRRDRANLTLGAIKADMTPPALRQHLFGPI